MPRAVHHEQVGDDREDGHQVGKLKTNCLVLLENT
jgi:hypothetical protein